MNGDVCGKCHGSGKVSSDDGLMLTQYDCGRCGGTGKVNAIPFEPIYDDIKLERIRQENLMASGRFKFTAANPGLTHTERLPMLVGEIGEVATQVEQQPNSGLMPVDVLGNLDKVRAGVSENDSEAGTPAGLRRELIQVAAIAVAWIEAIDSLNGSTSHAPRAATDSPPAPA